MATEPGAAHDHVSFGCERLLMARCAEPSPSTGLYRNWPHVKCNLEVGHKREHRHDRSDGVSFEWPPRASGE